MRPAGAGGSFGLTLAALSAFLLATALALGKPGLPSTLRGHEAAYLLQATSLAADGDLAIDAGDLERLFADYPHGGRLELPVRATAPLTAAVELGAEAFTVDRPLLYPLLAAPWLAIFGVNGPLALNVLLATGSIALLGLFFARRREPGGLELTTATAIVVLSALFPYLFRVHPATLWATLGALVLFGSGRRAAIGGAAWALLCFPFPSALAVAPAMVLREGEHRGRWLAGAAAGAVLGLALALVGAQAPLADDGYRYTVSVAPPAQVEAGIARFTIEPTPPPAVLATPGGGLAATLRDAFIEQRRGLLPYFPLVLLGLGGAAEAWRRLETWRWLLLAGLLVHVVMRAAADGGGLGGELLGDPGQAALYPLFFLLAPSLPRAGLRLAAFALATLLLGAALVAALGPAAAFGDPQAHTRGSLLARLPLALHHVGRAGVYAPMELGGPPALDARLWWPAYAGETRGDELWVLGGERVPLYLDVAEPLAGSTLWRLRNLAPGNVVRLNLGGQPRRIAFPRELPPGGQGADVEWPAGDGIAVTAPGGETRYVYPLRVSTETGYKPSWGSESSRTFYLGTAVTFLGPRTHLEADLYAAGALGCGAPPRVGAGESFLALVRLRNESGVTWSADGAVRVRLAHRWQQGETAIGGPRTDLDTALPPGADWSTWLEATAPTAPGRYRLVVDLVYENVAFFADRRGEPLCTLEIEVAAGEDGPVEGG